MIVTLTPNPSVDRTVEVDALIRGAVLRARSSYVDPGGKGVNLARALAANGRKTCAVLPAGQALEAVAAALEARGRAAGGDAQAVLEAQAMMTRDPGLAEQVEQLAAGRGAARAVYEAFGVYRKLLGGAGDYMAARVADLDDVRDRVVARLLGVAMPGVPDPGHPFVLVARDLAPADTATLRREQVLALVTEEGGPTSHTAILAKSMGVPAVVACPGATRL